MFPTAADACLHKIQQKNREKQDCSVSGAGVCTTARSQSCRELFTQISFIFSFRVCYNVQESNVQNYIVRNN